MSISRRAITALAATAVVSATTAAVLGVAAQSDATPAPATTAAVPVNAKLPTADPCCGRLTLRPGQTMDSSIPSDSTITSGGLGAGADNAPMTTSPYFLTVQTDGNLVEYREVSPGQHVAVWSTGTRSSTPPTLTFQSDGNVVLRNRAGVALWATGTAGKPATYFDVYGNGQIVTQDSTGHVISAAGPAQVALPGMVVNETASPDYYDGPNYRFVVPQSDGNLVEYQQTGQTKRAVWATNTAGVGPVRLDAQADGNLVLRQISTGRAVWASGSHGPNAYYQLDMQDDGNLVYYRTDGIRRVQAVWSTGVRH